MSRLTCFASSFALLIGACAGGTTGGEGGDGDTDGDADVDGDVDGDTDADGDGDGDGEGDADADPLPEGEALCDGFDDDRDDAIDEGCSCAAGDTQDCWVGDPELAGVGACTFGTMTCEASFEFGEWAGCEGQGAPGLEVCGNGVDEDCSGADEECEVLVVDIDIDGDCVTASCPESHPFPIACDIVFEGGDDRGCVAYVPGSSEVYFQEGDVCSAGHLSGTMTCSTEEGGALDEDSCPINKDERFYESDPDDCPG